MDAREKQLFELKEKLWKMGRHRINPEPINKRMKELGVNQRMISNMLGFADSWLVQVIYKKCTVDHETIELMSELLDIDLELLILHDEAAEQALGKEK